MSSLEVRLIIPLAYGGKDDKSNRQLCDPKFARDFKTFFGNLVPGAQHYLIRLFSVSKLRIDDQKFFELRRLAMHFCILDQPATLSTAQINRLIKKSNPDDDKVQKLKVDFQKHHLVARSRAKIDYPHSDSWVNEDFNLTYVTTKRHAAFHGIFDNLSLENADYFIDIINHPGAVWDKQALSQGRELSKLFTKANREHLEYRNRQKAEHGKKRSGKK